MTILQADQKLFKNLQFVLHALKSI